MLAPLKIIQYFPATKTRSRLWGGGGSEPAGVAERRRATSGGPHSREWQAVGWDFVRVWESRSSRQWRDVHMSLAGVPNRFTFETNRKNMGPAVCLEALGKTYWISAMDRNSQTPGDQKWGPAFCMWNSFNFRNGLGIFSRFPLIFKVFWHEIHAKSWEKNLRSLNYFFRGFLAPLRIIQKPFSDGQGWYFFWEV